MSDYQNNHFVKYYLLGIINAACIKKNRNYTEITYYNHKKFMTLQNNNLNDLATMLKSYQLGVGKLSFTDFKQITTTLICAMEKSEFLKILVPWLFSRNLQEKTFIINLLNAFFQKQKLNDKVFILTCLFFDLDRDYTIALSPYLSLTDGQVYHFLQIVYHWIKQNPKTNFMILNRWFKLYKKNQNFICLVEEIKALVADEMTQQQSKFYSFFISIAILVGLTSLFLGPNAQYLTQAPLAAISSSRTSLTQSKKTEGLPNKYLVNKPAYQAIGLKKQERITIRANSIYRTPLISQFNTLILEGQDKKPALVIKARSDGYKLLDWTSHPYDVSLDEQLAKECRNSSNTSVTFVRVDDKKIGGIKPLVFEIMDTGQQNNSDTNNYFYETQPAFLKEVLSEWAKKNQMINCLVIIIVCQLPRLM